MSKTKWAKWLRCYYGIRLPRGSLKLVKRFIQVEGGRSTWNRAPIPRTGGEVVTLVEGSSMTFFAELRPGVTVDEFEQS